MSFDFSDLKIAVIGDVMLDVYINGSSSRLSPEAPVPVVSVDNTQYLLGGAGNVAANLRSLGCEVNLVSILGSDPNGDKFSHIANSKGIEIDNFCFYSTKPTTTKTRVIANRQQIVRYDFEDIPNSIDDLQYEECILNAIEGADAVILSDYDKGLITNEIARFVLNASKCPVFVDPKRNDWDKFWGAACIKPNKYELAHFLGFEPDQDQMNLLCKEIPQRHNFGALLLTLGEEGMILWQKENGIVTDPIKYTPRQVKVYDVSGAGDTAIAVLAAAYCKYGITVAAHMANIAAGIVVTKPGTAQVTESELNDAIHIQSGSIEKL